MIRPVLSRPFAALTALALLTALLGRPAAGAEPAAPAAIDFNRHVRPLLSENCFACHGPDDGQRKAKLRFDTRDGAFARLRDGGFAIVPGKPDESRLIDRLTTEDAGQLMPPPKTGKKLKPEQIALIKQWIAQGAKWSEHWAFTPPRRQPLPAVRDKAWPRTPIDHFILARLEAEGLSPNAEADRNTLIRRVTLDLTGLPPTMAEVEAFVGDPRADAYERLVERLLHSPRYGEHLARYWLDAARYGDTHGLHLDNYREIWPYRDWVISAFNRNLPFDRFVIEQLAGDLLPNATLDQIVATGFNRCHVTTSEGGSIEEEVYVRNTSDRVETTGTVFLGLTVGCAKCHDHKYDPIRMKDYYQLFAFFNSIDGAALDGNAARYPPIAKVPPPELAAKVKSTEDRIAALNRTVAEEVARAQYDEKIDAGLGEYLTRGDHVWIDDALPAGANAVIDNQLNFPWNFVAAPEHPVSAGQKSLLLSGDGLRQCTFQGGAALRLGMGDTLFAHVFLDPTDPPKAIMLQWYGGGNWGHRAYWGENAINFGPDNTAERQPMGPLPATGKWVRLEVPIARVGLKPGTAIDGWAFTQFGGTVYWDRAGLDTYVPQDNGPADTLTAFVRRAKAGLVPNLPADLKNVIKLERGKRTDAQKKQLRDYFVEHGYAATRPTFAPLHAQLAALKEELAQLDKQIPATLVYKEAAAPRPAFMLKRGEYDQRGDAVGREVPAFLPPLPPGLPRNRLGLAQWLVSPDHPLTARVTVNRLWQQCFGTGLVKTAEDFGSQGEPPSHPELLDWLAVQFREDGWDVRQTLRRMVLSAAYRQAARATPAKLAKDPANRLLARGPRYRLDAEMLRDQALAVSGLLVEKQGGPSVKPPQPGGLWEAVGYVGSNTANFTADRGVEKVHRRSVYTFWKRTAAPPQMAAFDAPSRESCTVRRERTNTPLQALLLLNEPQYVEAARALAERALKEGGPTPEAKAAWLFQAATARRPDTRELAELLTALRDHLANYAKNVEAAKQLVGVGETKADPALNVSDLAAWTMVANLVLNLDEVLCKG